MKTTNYLDSFTYPHSDCLLPHWQSSSQWCGTDNENLYKINCEQRPPYWIWENRPIEYVWNKEGYRAPEWSTVEWPTTHVIMGCSFVLGVGVNEDETLGYQLSQQLKEPVVNLGYGGGSAQVVMYNTMRMQELGWKPQTVTIVIPELSRLTYFNDHEVLQFNTAQLEHHDGSDNDIFSMYKHWVSPKPNAELHGRMAIKGAVAIWQAMGVPVILRHHMLFPHQMAMAPKLNPIQDFGRDLIVGPTGKPIGHPGPLTLGYWARTLADEIRLL
jgi:hypothetical protein